MNDPPRLRTGWVAISRPSTFAEDSGHAAQNFQIGLPQTDGQNQDRRADRRLSLIPPYPAVEYDWAGSLGWRDQFTCAHVLRLTAARAVTSLMPNSAASCR